MNDKSSSDIALYIATHKQEVQSTDTYIIPIQTGAALSEKRICKEVDSSGINISEKNHEFCELTALYWIWKNSKKSIVGLSHYRRRFLINSVQINNILKEYDVIIPPVYYFRSSLREEYRKMHIEKDMDELFGVLQTLYPDTIPFFNDVLDNNVLIPYNMLIASKEIVNTYCEWLFPILFELENHLDFTKRDLYQRRVMGFLAERLFTTYIYMKSYNTYTCSVKIPETETLCRHIKYEIGRQFNKIFFDLRK